jgi:probable addiction module antidote protein
MVKVETETFDPADYVRAPDEAALYLNDAISSGDPRVLAAALGTLARAKGASELAREAGVSRASLYNSLSPNGNPTLALLMSVLEKLDLELSVKVGSQSSPPATA